jgi:hypothetical protein
MGSGTWLVLLVIASVAHLIALIILVAAAGVQVRVGGAKFILNNPSEDRFNMAVLIVTSGSVMTFGKVIRGFSCL